MSLRTVSIESYILPLNWIERIKSFNIHDSNLGKNNRILAEKLKHYILKYKENSLMSSEVKSLISYIIDAGKFENYFIEDLETEFIVKVLDEIKNQQNYQFNLKLKSLYMEIATMHNYQKKGYLYHNIEYKEGNADLTLKKDSKLFEVQVKHKQSIDEFLDTIEGYIQGQSMLSNYAYLQKNDYCLSINQNSLDKSERKKAWEEVVKFVKNKKHFLDGEYLTIHKNTIINKQIEQTFITQKEKSTESIANIISRVIEQLDKQYEKKSEDKVFIGVIIWSIPFHMNANLQLIEEMMKKEIKVKYQLDITLVPNILSDTKTCNFILPHFQL